MSPRLYRYVCKQSGNLSIPVLRNKDKKGNQKSCVTVQFTKSSEVSLYKRESECFIHHL